MQQSLRLKPLLRLASMSIVLLLLVACSPSQPASAPTSTVARPPASPALSASPSLAPAVQPSPSASAATGNSITLIDALKFEPSTLTVAKGTTVTWRNTSQIVHTVTDDPSKAANKQDAELPSGVQAWDSGNLNPGQTFSHTFDVPGTYKYFCQPHETAGMLGTIIVTS